MTIVRKQIQSLSLEQLEVLGEVLLDFSEIADLLNWLVPLRGSQKSKVYPELSRRVKSQKADQTGCLTISNGMPIYAVLY